MRRGDRGGRGWGKYIGLGGETKAPTAVAESLNKKGEGGQKSRRVWGRENKDFHGMLNIG